MKACLAALGFCRFDGQYRATDALAQQRLETIMTALARDAGEIVTDGPGALAWLTAAAESVIIAEKTPETAGIQILSSGEARGLAFEKLWVVGAHSAALPPPAPEYPFLDPDEQRRMEDGTIEQQWKRGQRQLAALVAAAPEAHFSRAAANGDEAPYLPCPMLPDKTDANNQPAQETLNLWEDLSAELMRTRWLRDGCRGLRAVGKAAPIEAGSQALSGAWSVSAVKDLAACPFLFLCGRMLKLKPLALTDTGIDPRLRGQVLHAILKTFMDGLAANAAGWPADGKAALEWLIRTGDEALARWPKNIFWRVERRRLLGDGQTPGVLTAWLEQERQRALVGWRVVGTEIPFEGLAVAGITLNGRIDRIDRHPTEGLAVWDYKSGGTPAASAVIPLATEIQLPAYLLALQRGLVPGFEPETTNKSNSRSNERPRQHKAEENREELSADPALSGTPLQAGYIGLRKAPEVTIAALSVRRQPVNWNKCLPEWEKTLDQRLAAPRQGRYATEPRPAIPVPFHRRGGPCQYCEFFNLCGYFDRQQEIDDQENEQDLV
jgi:RecB family exonuclease